MHRVVIVRCVNICAANYFLKSYSSDPLIEFFIFSTCCIWSVPLWFWVLWAFIEWYQYCTIDRGVPVTLEYEFICVWTEVFFNVEIFNFFNIWINKVFSKDAFWIWNRLYIIFSICRAICFILFHCDDLLEYIESSIFRIV